MGGFGNKDMQRAMDKQAEAERERRIKVINADGEFPAAAKLAEAAVTVQLSYVQTMRETASARNTTSFFHPDELAGVHPEQGKLSGAAFARLLST